MMKTIIMKTTRRPPDPRTARVVRRKPWKKRKPLPDPLLKERECRIELETENEDDDEEKEVLQ